MNSGTAILPSRAHYPALPSFICCVHVIALCLKHGTLGGYAWSVADNEREAKIALGITHRLETWPVHPTQETEDCPRCGEADSEWKYTADWTGLAGSDGHDGRVAEAICAVSDQGGSAGMSGTVSGIWARQCHRAHPLLAGHLCGVGYDHTRKCDRPPLDLVSNWELGSSFSTFPGVPGKLDPVIAML